MKEREIKERMYTKNIMINEKLDDKLRIRSFETNKSNSMIIREALEEYFEKYPVHN